MREQIEILSIPVDVVTMHEAVERIEQMTAHPGLHVVCTANAEMIMCARENPRLKEILQTASLVVPDGAGALWAAEKQGKSFPERVAGLDLAKALFQMATEKRIPLYCLGAAPGVAAKAVEKLKQEYGDVPVVGIHDGYFDDIEEEKIIREIEESGAKIVFVALGVPRQEIWIAEHLRHLSGVVGIGLGGSFDVISGNLVRAPKWMQEARLEWLYRLCKQPSRVGRMMAIPKFMMAVKKDLKARREV